MAAQAAGTPSPQIADTYCAWYIHPPECPERGLPLFGVSLKALEVWMVRSPFPLHRKEYEELFHSWSSKQPQHNNRIAVVYSYAIEPNDSLLFCLPWRDPSQKEQDLFESVVRNYTLDSVGRTCFACGGRDVRLLRCSSCKQRRVCGIECARKDWPTHRQQCSAEKMRRHALKAADAWPPRFQCGVRAICSE
jgi:hypothetical protein